MEVDGGAHVAGRVFCPVAGCPCADPLRARGWASATTMHAHIDAHLAGSLQGDVPAAWLQAHSRQRCSVCGLSVSTRHAIHPTCRPQARAAAGAPRGVPRAGSTSLPSVSEIQAGRTPTLRHIPPAARSLWCKVLTKALAAVVRYNDLSSWQDLLALPQCVLNAPPRGGRKHAKAAAAYTLDRLRRWEDGERLLLWESRGRPSTRHRTLTAAERRDLATSLAREGFEGKACGALLAEGLAPENSGTVAALQALHPVQPDPVAPPVHELPPSPELVPDAVAKALRSFPAATAPGPSGLRVQHLREACWPGGRDSLLEQLAGVVTLLASGSAHSAAAPLVAGANLVAIPKPQGGVRPIAIGEVLRRLTGKCLMELVRDDARSVFFPVQLGVAAPSGSEVAVHCVRDWQRRHAGSADKVLVKLDFANAFNTVSRQEVLSAACAHFPTLARWVNWCYGGPSTLQFGSSALQSAAGVQQSDPLGPLLFSAALHPLAAELRAGPLDIAMFYLDDGVVAGDVAAVGAALKHIERRAAGIGLRLNLSKCEVVVPGPATAADLSAALPSPVLWGECGGERVLHNFEFLGAAIGADDFVAAHTEQRVSKAAALLDAIAELEDPQVALRLLRACAGHTRLLHSMRCNPPQPPQAALEHFDDLVRTCFSSFTGLHIGTNPVAAGNPGAVASGSGSPLHVSGRGCGLPGLGWRQCSPVLRGGCAHRGGLCIPPGPGRLGSLQPVHPCPHDRGRCLSAAPENFGWADGPGSMEPAA